MSQIAPILSAIAATVAAVLAGLNLYVLGRREQRKWTRDALIDAYVEYLGASFRVGARKLRSARLDGGTLEAIDAVRRASEEAHVAQNETRTRLRLIAPENVVKAADALHDADHAVWDAAIESGDDEWHRVLVAQRDARGRFIGEARKSLALGPGAPMEVTVDPPSLSWGDRPRSSE